MTIRRFDATPWIDDGEARVMFEVSPSGAWVSYDDHAAAIAAMTERAERAEKERDSLTASIISACTGSGCLNPHELRAALDRTHKRATNAEKENAVLRAECEASRNAFVHVRGCWIRMADNPGEGLFSGENTEAMLAYRAATDAAGALKGVE